MHLQVRQVLFTVSAIPKPLKVQLDHFNELFRAEMYAICLGIALQS